MSGPTFVLWYYIAFQVPASSGFLILLLILQYLSVESQLHPSYFLTADPLPIEIQIYILTSQADLIGVQNGLV